MKKSLLIILVLLSFTLNVNAEDINSSSYSTQNMQDDLDVIKKSVSGEEGWRQEDIDDAYKRLENAGVDTGEGWFSDRSLQKTEASIQEIINQEKTQIVEAEKQKEVEKVEAERRISDLETRVANDDRGRLEVKNAEETKKSAEVQAKSSLENQFEANSKMTNAMIEADEKKAAYEAAKKKTEEANAALEQVNDNLDTINNDLNDAIDRGDLAEVERLRKDKADAEETKKSAEVQAKSSLENQFEANSKMTNAMIEADEKKAAYEAAKKKTEEANAALEEAKKKAEECGADVEKCGAELLAQERAEAEKEQADLEAKKKAEEQADAAIDKSINDVNTVCSNGDTPACRSAIQEMNKKEAEKACLEPSSNACKEANEILEESKNMTEQYVLDAKIKAEKAKAEQDNLAANPGLEAIQNKGNTDTMNALLGITTNNVLESTNKDSKDGGFTVLSKFTVWFKNTLTGLVQLIAVGALLFVGIRLAFARGNPEEFKKALVHMVYVIVGIFVIAVSWAAVVLVAGINI